MFFLRRKKQLPKSVVSGWLAPVDGHQIFYHTYGNLNGTPVLCFHGGPGGSSKAKHALCRLVLQNAVTINDDKATDPTQMFTTDKTLCVRVGRKTFFKVTKE